MKTLKITLVILFCLLFFGGTKTVYALPASYDYITVETENKIYHISRKDLYFAFGEAVFYDLDAFSDKVSQENYLPPENAKYVYDAKSKQITVKSESFGKKIDVNALKEDIKICLSAGGGRVKAKYIEVPPDYKASDLPSKTYLRGKFTTSFHGSDSSRVNNLKLAAKSINGTTVYADQTFSFNACVGVRNEDSGYQSAKVIIGGKFVDGVGGGVCQVSTTLYNAALLADLKVTEQHRHTLAVGYVEKSFDAMVSYGYADLKIKNTTGAPLYVRAFTENDTVTFCIYGVEMLKKVERQSVITKVIEPEIKTVLTDALGSGESRIVTVPKRGYESEGYLIISENGSTESRFLRKDEYKKVDGVVEVGK